MNDLKYKENNTKNLIKLLLILTGMIFLFRLWYGHMESGIGKKAPQGEPISVEDVKILLEALNIDLGDEALNYGRGHGITNTESGTASSEKNAAVNAPVEYADDAGQSYLTYGQYKMIYEHIDGADKKIPDFADKYEDEHHLLKEDWYSAFEIMLAFYDTESSIWKTTIFVLKTDNEAAKLYTPENGYTYLSSSFKDAALNKEEVYVRNDEILTCVKTLDEKTVLKNVWIMEVSDKEDGYKYDCFYHQTAFDLNASDPAEREQVADLTFEKGALKKAVVKSDKIRGKLLSISENSMEIEGLGNYELEDGMEIYKLYGDLRTQEKNDLMIGYDYTDFVVKDDKICACLVSREGELDTIRVLLKNTANGSYYFDKASVIVDGERTEVNAEQLKDGERLSFQSNALTDRVKIEIEGVNKADNAYRGKIEFYKSDKGMTIINELPLEEYLYAVVPSEMPSYYPIEALKAQAVCARTYAYRHILHAGLADFGAHLDDTTSYQVYHNIDENAATTTAVKETDGMMLYYNGEPAENYYYSTSCGYGTDTAIWKSGEAQDIPYIEGIRIADAQASDNAVSAEELKEEEKFAAFIKSVDEADLESKEAWYRWRCEVKDLDIGALLGRLKERYKANASLVLTQVVNGDENYYVSEEPENIGDIKDISIVKRGEGGIADELLITGSEAVYKVVSEYNIRRILCDGKSSIIRQDGSSIEAGSLLPSAFLIIEALKKDDNVVGYTLIGGGYGHGVGMSQNAAKEAGSRGYDYQQILSLFFKDCEVRK